MSCTWSYCQWLLPNLTHCTFNWNMEGCTDTTFWWRSGTATQRQKNLSAKLSISVCFNSFATYLTSKLTLKPVLPVRSRFCLMKTSTGSSVKCVVACAVLHLVPPLHSFAEHGLHLSLFFFHLKVFPQRWHDSSPLEYLCCGTSTSRVLNPGIGTNFRYQYWYRCKPTFSLSEPGLRVYTV